MRSNCKVLHETILRDLFDLADYIKKSDVEEDILSGKNRKNKIGYGSSIARKTDNLVLVFPVMVSTGLTIDTSVMLMKALERKYVTMIQMLFAAYQIQDVASMQDIIAKFHRNIKLGKADNIDGFLDTMDRFSEEHHLGNKIDKVLVEAVRADMKNINFYVEENVNPKPLSEFGIRRDAYNRQILVEDIGGEDAYLNNAKLAKGDAYLKQAREAERAAERQKRINDANDRKDDAKKIKDDLKIRGQMLKSDPNLVADTMGVSQKSIDKRDRNFRKPFNPNDVSEANAKTLLPIDIKKANELMPTMMSINYCYQGDNGEAIEVENAVIGVKARLIPCDSNDIITHVMNKVQDRNWLLQFIRATTREISFARDFLLCIDRAKVDALSHSRKGSSNPMWKVLERRAIGSRIRRLLGSNNPNMAITTLAVSQEDVDRAYKEYSVSFESPKIVEPLFDNLNLMCVCIADESLEVAKFMFDTGDGNWENYSFTSLERENQDNTYKKVINLMTKVAR